MDGYDDMIDGVNYSCMQQKVVRLVLGWKLGGMQVPDGAKVGCMCMDYAMHACMQECVRVRASCLKMYVCCMLMWYMRDKGSS